MVIHGCNFSKLYKRISLLWPKTSREHIIPSRYMCTSYKMWLQRKLDELKTSFAKLSSPIVACSTSSIIEGRKQKEWPKALARHCNLHLFAHARQFEAIQSLIWAHSVRKCDCFARFKRKRFLPLLLPLSLSPCLSHHFSISSHFCGRWSFILIATATLGKAHQEKSIGNWLKKYSIG